MSLSCGHNLHHRLALLFLAGLCLPSGQALAQLRVCTWNVTNYSGGRVAEFQTSFYGSFEGRSMAPDVVIAQEFTGSGAGVPAMVNVLNTAPGSPGDWAAAPFIDGPDTDNAFFYRTSRVTFLGVTTINSTTGTSDQPRNTERYDIRPVGYLSDATVISCYSSHMKAGSSSTDQSRRLVEAQRIRDNAQGIDTNGPGSARPLSYGHFLLGGDFNIQSSNQAAYVEMTGSQANNIGRLIDPINTPGSWNNNSFYRFVHTQDPAGAGGMDDRHDQILVSSTLLDGQGFDYIGNSTIPYSTTTWNDLNHSYRCWGNDGTSYNNSLTIAGNTMVGSVIAQALQASANGQGHLPVYLDLRVPSQIAADSVIDFGTVNLGDNAQMPLTVSNAGDVSLWTAGGIDDLDYTLAASAGFAAPGGAFVEPAGGGSNMHTIVMDTTTAGLKMGTLTINSDAPDFPVIQVTMVGEVLVPGEDCPGDANGDNFVDVNDLNLVIGNFGTSGPAGDLTGDNSVDVNDLNAVIGNFGTNCN